MLLCGTLLFLQVVGCGCVFFSSITDDTGRRHEQPVIHSFQDGPFLSAWRHREKGDCLIEYRVLANRVEESRWLLLRPSQVASNLPPLNPKDDSREYSNHEMKVVVRENHNAVLLRRDFLVHRVRHRKAPDEEAWQRMTPYRLVDEYEFEDTDWVGISTRRIPNRSRGPDRLAHRYHILMDLPQTPGPDLIQFEFPRRSYRTAGGRVVAVGAGLLDVATAPVQGVLLIGLAGAWAAGM
jgi:hypothetical protein